MKHPFMQKVLIILVIAFTFTTITFAEEPIAKNPATTILIVRHAEKVSESDSDPQLTLEGEKRAQRLANMLKECPLTAVFATSTTRAIETGNNSAQQAGLAVTTYHPRKNLVQEILAKHPGETVLVVGHSNTVPQLLADSGYSNPPNIDDQYDNLFIVVHDGSEATVTRLKF